MYVRVSICITNRKSKYRKVFGPEREEVPGFWRKLHIEKLHDFYSSPVIIMVM
jgi:hypothetical protein